MQQALGYCKGSFIVLERNMHKPWWWWFEHKAVPQQCLGSAGSAVQAVQAVYHVLCIDGHTSLQGPRGDSGVPMASSKVQHSVTRWLLSV